jgi:hypothetical protein
MQRSVPGYVPGKKNLIESCRGQRLFNWVTIVRSWPLHLGGISLPPGTTAILIVKKMQIYGCHATNQVHCKDSWENNYSKVLQGEYETYLELGTMCLKFNSIKLCRRTFFNQLANSCLVVLRACEERGAQEPSNGVSTRVIRFQLLKRTSSPGSGYFFKLMGQSFWVL